MSFTSIDICSHALVKLGALPISSFNENTIESQVSRQLYQTVLESILASYPWRFALKQVELGRLNKTPKADYKYAYQLPNDTIRVLSAGRINLGRGLQYRIHHQELQTDSDQVVLTYISRPDESDFPPFFVDALISKLAMEFCLPLTESTTRTEYFRKLFEENLKTARLIDSQQAVPQAFQDFSLIEVRE